MISIQDSTQDYCAETGKFIWTLKDLNNYAVNLVPQIREKESMALHTTFKLGGPADLFFEPTCEDDLIQILDVCRHQRIPVTLIGRGSNLVVSDRGIRGMVVALNDRFSNIRMYRPKELLQSSWNEVLGEEAIRGDVYYIYVESGKSIADLSKEFANQGLAGLSFACGIPGTVGGAIFMNAGAYGASIEDVVIATRYLDENLNLQTCIGSHHNFGYRHSVFRDNNYVILGTLFMLHHSDPGLLLSEIADFTNRREKTQPLDEPSGGSVFKRPVGNYTGKLITEAGLKGYRVGGAVVSEKHAGFIVNRGNAKAMDVVELVHHIQRTIMAQNNIQLETELRFIGDYLPEELALIGSRAPE